MTTTDTATARIGGPLIGRLPLVTAVAGGLASGAILVLVGLVAGGESAAYGALVGTVLVVGVMAFGAFSVNLVAGVLPAASLLVAVVTYGAQITTTLVALRVLNDSGLLDDGTLDRAWLGAAVIVAVLAWSAAQIIAVVRMRMPLYDLPEAGAR